MSEATRGKGKGDMSILTIIGIGLAAGVVVTDRFIHKLPQWLAIALFSAAWVMIIAGMIASRNAGLIK